jgi:beta-glucosidase
MCMRKLFVSVLLSAVCSAASAQVVYPFQNTQLGGEERISDLLQRLTMEEKINMFSGAGVQRLGVLSCGGMEAIHGLVQGGPAWGTNRKDQVTTVYPQGYGLGETWDRELIGKIGRAMGYEARYLYQSPKYQRGALVLWTPNADMGRDPRWGRTEECYGEDPFLTGALVTSMVKGLQGNHPQYWLTASLMKHFLANSNECGRAETSSDFDEELFYDYYSYSFRKGIQDGKCNALMTAYNAYNGITCTIHPVLRDVLMKKWGFNGLITTDGGAFQQLKNVRHLFNTHDEAAAACIKAGTTRFLDDYKPYLCNAVAYGLVTEKQLDENIKGNLRVMLKLGLLDNSEDNPYKYIGVNDTIDPWTKQETKDFVRLVADKSAVLLKNDHGLLPLDGKKIKKIAVIGNRADVVLEDWYCGTLPYKITPLDGIKEIAQKEGIEVRFVKNDNRSQASKAAAWADVAIVCLGNDPTGSTEWEKAPWSKAALASDGREDVDRNSLQLEQEDLLRVVYKANPQTVALLICSFPYTINWTQGHVPAILHFTQSCQELGHAVADVLFGKFNPAGRTTQTWVKSIDELPEMNDYNIRDGRTYMYYHGEPLYAFGHGMSYTQFKYSDMVVDKSALNKDDSLNITIDVANIGHRDGDEVVQLYVKLPGDNAAMRLKGFNRIYIPKGESQKVAFTLKSEDVSLWNMDAHAYGLPKGKMKLMIGAASDDIRVTRTITIR